MNIKYLKSNTGTYLNKKNEVLDRIVSVVPNMRNNRIELNFDKTNLTERIF